MSHTRGEPINSSLAFENISADLYGDDIMSMLNVQYSMHGLIMTRSSKELYNNKIKAHASAAGHILYELEGVEKSSSSTEPTLLLIDIGNLNSNNADQVIFDKVAEINTSKDCWNLRVKVVMLWKPTYINNLNMVASLDMILIDQENLTNNKKNLIPVFESLFDEGAVREISNFDMASNESEYMLVPHKHKINFNKTTKVRVSTDFVDTIDPYHFISFPDLLARIFNTRVAFDFLGEVVSTDPMRVIVEYGREKRLMNLISPDLRIRIVVRVQDESGSSSFVLFECHSNYRAYTVHKLTDDERVLAEVFKRPPNHQHHNINDNGTPINKAKKENINFVHDDNLDVVDLKVVTPSSSTGKGPIEIDANTDSLEWSSSKTRAVRDTLKIPKLEKLD
ncbi:unnamed protein product [Lactuca saligna]|uniref:Uncharacterized protein n=1 Tax=Lactuca saligna TaxID=75948 RepID=A0AA35YVL9_LACSI|nr:unnamed protein product [Lactuca saligna]